MNQRQKVRSSLGWPIAQARGLAAFMIEILGWGGSRSMKGMPLYLRFQGIVSITFVKAAAALATNMISPASTIASPSMTGHKADIVPLSRRKICGVHQ